MTKDNGMGLVENARVVSGLCDVCRKPLSAHNRGAGIPICPGIAAPSYRSTLNDQVVALSKPVDAPADQAERARAIADEAMHITATELADKILAFASEREGEKASTGRETIESMIAWGDDTFGPCAPERAVSRAAEEWREMEGEEPGSVQHAIEAADVIICLLRIPGIVDAINAKMAKNRARKWSLMGDGTGYHVGGSGPPATPNSGEVAIPECNCAARLYGDDRNAHQLCCAALGDPRPAASRPDVVERATAIAQALYAAMGYVEWDRADQSIRDRWLHAADVAALTDNRSDLSVGGGE